MKNKKKKKKKNERQGQRVSDWGHSHTQKNSATGKLAGGSMPNCMRKYLNESALNQHITKAANSEKRESLSHIALALFLFNLWSCDFMKSRAPNHGHLHQLRARRKRNRLVAV